MPFALGIIGLMLIVSGARGNYAQLKSLLADDFTGERNFWFWIVALGATGLLGYVPGLEKFSRMMMFLIVLAMVLAQSRDGRGGFFENFMQAIENLKAGSGSGSAPDSGGGDLNEWYKGIPSDFFGGAATNVQKALPLLKDPGSLFGIGN